MFERLIPTEYRELLDYISPAAFKTIEWKKVLRSLAQLSKNTLDLEGRRRVANALENIIGDDLILKENFSKNDKAVSRRELLAEGILEFYFSQFFCSEGLFLDLRLKKFQLDDDSVLYLKNGLWWTFQEDFRNAMIAIYEGFYFDNPSLLRKGMEEAGLISSEGTEQDYLATKNLLFKHFGTAKNKKHLFKTKDYKKSFHSLFLHLKAQGIRLPADFVFLGIYLTTLYQSLEELEIPVDVSGIVAKTWERATSSRV